MYVTPFSRVKSSIKNRIGTGLQYGYVYDIEVSLDGQYVAYVKYYFVDGSLGSSYSIYWAFVPNELGTANVYPNPSSN